MAKQMRKITFLFLGTLILSLILALKFAYPADNIFSDKVGIGITTPVADLDIYNITTGTTFALRIASTASSQLLSVLDNGNVGIGTTAPVGRLEVASSGNVGIGTTNPGASLTVFSSSTAPTQTLYIKSSGTSAGLTSGIVLGVLNSNTCGYGTLSSPTGPITWRGVTCP